MAQIKAVCDASRGCGPVIALLMLAALTAPGSAYAASGTSAALVNKLLACRRVSGNSARLHCFDQAAAALAGPARVSSVSDAAVKEAVSPRKTFGLSSSAIVAREVAAGTRPKTVSKITERITALRTGPDGRVIYDLANGQVWRELVADGYAPPVRVGEAVRISRGWLGSYWMQAPSGQGCKVERIH